MPLHKPCDSIGCTNLTTMTFYVTCCDGSRVERGICRACNDGGVIWDGYVLRKWEDVCPSTQIPPKKMSEQKKKNKCTCGAEKANLPAHSPWCDK